MNQIKSEIEIQAVNLAQQWYSLPHDQLPGLPDLLSHYIRCFPDPADREAFLRETLRIAEELTHSPKPADTPERSFSVLKDALLKHIGS